MGKCEIVERVRLANLVDRIWFLKFKLRENDLSELLLQYKLSPNQQRVIEDYVEAIEDEREESKQDNPSFDRYLELFYPEINKSKGWMIGIGTTLGMAFGLVTTFLAREGDPTYVLGVGVIGGITGAVVEYLKHPWQYMVCKTPQLDRVPGTFKYQEKLRGETVEDLVGVKKRGYIPIRSKKWAFSEPIDFM